MDEHKDRDLKSEAYPPNWWHCMIRLNPQTGEMHSEGDHRVREWIRQYMPHPLAHTEHAALAVDIKVLDQIKDTLISLWACQGLVHSWRDESRLALQTNDAERMTALCRNIVDGTKPDSTKLLPCDSEVWTDKMGFQQRFILWFKVTFCLAVMLFSGVLRFHFVGNIRFHEKISEP